MKNPLRKRYLREIRQEAGKYIALFLFLTLTVGFCSGMDVASGSMISAYKESFTKYNIEDGHFLLEKKADETILQAVREQDAQVYPLFYRDFEQADGNTIRVYQNRDQINLPCVMEGKLPEMDDEIVLDRLFAENNSLKTGDICLLGSRPFTIVGTVALSDYSTMFKNNTDMMFNASVFSIALVTEDAFAAMDPSTLKYCYGWIYNDPPVDDQESLDRSEEIMKAIVAAILGMSLEEAESRSEQVGTFMTLFEILSGSGDRNMEQSLRQALDHFVGSDSNKLKDFVPRPANRAIIFTGDDMTSDNVFTNFFLYLLIVILAFVYAVTTRNTIEQEASVIGTLRASGYTIRELLVHYMTVPLLVSAAAAAAGNVLGYTILKQFIVVMYYHSYSLPSYRTIWNGNAFITTTVVPFIIILAVNALVIRRALSRTPLEFLRRDLSSAKRKGAVPLPEWKFLSRFRARILLQNIPAYLIMFVGVLLAGLLMVYGLMFSPLLSHFKEILVESRFAEYQYILKEQAESDYEGAEKFAMTSLENENEEISVYGIREDSVYLPDLDFGPKGERVYISSAYADKYDLTPGSYIRLHEKYGDHAYTLEVGDIMDYEATLCVFLSLDHYSDTFDLEKDYFNGYFSNEEIKDLDERDISTVITTEDLTLLADQLKDSLGIFFPIMSIFAVVLFVLMIYLLAKLVIDRSAQSISMMKILGYSSREISMLYNRATGIVALLSLLISLPVSYWSLALVLKVLMMRYNGWLTLYIAPWIYGACLGLGFVCYLLVDRIEMHRIGKIPMAMALKNVE